MYAPDFEVVRMLSEHPDPAHVWDTLVAEGTPLIDADSTRMTFLIESTAPAVHLWINRLTDKERHDLGVMQHVPGLPYWVKTVAIPPDLIASYCFRLTDSTHRPPGHNTFPHLRDPHARFGAVVTDEDHRLGTSLILGANAAVGQEWRALNPQIPPRVQRGAVAVGHEVVPSYFFAPAVPMRNVPVLVLLDADIWFERMHLDQALDLAISQGRVPPVAVVGIGFHNSQQRARLLNPSATSMGVVLDGLFEWAQTSAVRLGVEVDCEQVVIAGQSLGGLAALNAAMAEPRRFRFVIASSPSLWWHPGKSPSPKDLITQSQPWFVEKVAHTKSHSADAHNHEAEHDGGTTDTPTAPNQEDMREKYISYTLRTPRKAAWASPEINQQAQLPPAYLSVGIREGLSVAHMHGLQRAMNSIGWANTLDVADGGHDLAWWREALITHLGHALRHIPNAEVNFLIHQFSIEESSTE
ncbi:alpha/beta hydrolase-fold protein [Corynebacterium felinum]|nr:alpha/beta hydrolase-fold protein [Corynebacterium felinum]MDF5820778.1 alpha/beta hydrolase-fold protein [Corynebacterium felinum]WJY95998.1 Enterochelin esterase [Corynebacterium felinum]